jgi:hypothetical protein
MKGYSESEVIGRHYSMFFTKDAIDAGKPYQEVERARLDGRFEEEGWRLREFDRPFGQMWFLRRYTRPASCAGM